jgi:hypothetical protein
VVDDDSVTEVDEEGLQAPRFFFFFRFPPSFFARMYVGATAVVVMVEANVVV